MGVTKLFLRRETIFPSLCVNLRIAQERQLLGCVDVGHLLDEALCEDDVDLFERAVFCLRVEDVDDGEEAGVYCGEEKVCTCDWY
jgi:hypothetical protein